MKINITLPVWNEAEALLHTIPYLQKFFKEFFSDSELFIVIADNGSTDNTEKVIYNLIQEDPNIFYLNISKRGRGNALIASWQKYPADLYGYIDVDLDTDPSAFIDMVELMNQDNDIVVGSRVHPESITIRPWYRKLASLWSNLVIRLAFDLDPTDTQCGLKMINNKVKNILLPKIQEKGWFFDLELLLLARKHGLKAGAVPVKDKYNRFMKRKSKVSLFKDSLIFLKTVYNLKRQGL